VQGLDGLQAVARPGPVSLGSRTAGTARCGEPPLAILPLPPRAPKPALETDLKTLADAANEAAKREATQWFFLVTLMVYLGSPHGSFETAR
jgi:hypothetical protein